MTQGISSFENRHGRAQKCLGGFNAAPHDKKRMEDARKEVADRNRVEAERAANRHQSRRYRPFYRESY